MKCVIPYCIHYREFKGSNIVKNRNRKSMWYSNDF